VAFVISALGRLYLPTRLRGSTVSPVENATALLSYGLYAASAGGPPQGYFLIDDEAVETVDARSKLSANTWTHLAVTYDGSTARLYRNGTLVNEETITGPISTDSGELHIGGNTMYGDYFKGIIDDVRIYNRAQTSAEIATDMNTPLGGTTASVVADRSSTASAAATAPADGSGIEEICTPKTAAVSFTTPGTPAPNPVEDVRHLTLNKDSFVIKSAMTDPTACDGSPCTVTDSTTIRIGGTGTNSTAAVVGFRLDELPEGAGVAEAILKLGTPTCDGGACPADTVITVAPLKNPVSSQTKGSDLAGDVDPDVELFQLPISAPQADIAGDEDRWLMLTSNKEVFLSFGEVSATEQPSIVLTYLPAGPPSKVLNLAAQAGDGSATASWGIPETTGSVALLTGYDVEVADGSGTIVKSLEVKDPYAAITGLTNAQTYTIRVRSKTPFGTSEWESTSVTPKAVPPPPAENDACIPFLDTPPATAKASSESGAQEYVDRVKRYYEAQDAVLEGRAETVWDVSGVTPRTPSTAKLSLLNTALVEQRAALESFGQSRTNSTVTLENSVVQAMPDGTVRVLATVKRAWTEPDPSTESSSLSEVDGQVEPIDPTINVHVFDRCGNMTVIQVPLEVEEDSTDFGDFDVAYLWDSSGPPTASARSGDASASVAAVADIPPPPASDKYWQYGFDSIPLKKSWILGIAMASHWEPFSDCSPSSCSNRVVQWKLDPVRNAMKFYPRGRSWGTGPNAPVASWTNALAKYILKNSTASITATSCFKVAKMSTSSTIGFRVGFEGAQGTGDVSGSYQVSTSMEDVCQKATAKWKRGYANKPVTFDPYLGRGECADVTGKCLITAYRSELTGHLTFAYYTDKNGKKKTYQEERVGISCNWAVPNGTTAGSLKKNCIRSQ
ncbi:LamG-like jellyroll fold domain-containing protein, partial [Nonomuraea sp. NPDC049421]|uniref:LamG-like jellyroll fold domain-containing protein n=1 Tax=Nonomuraea sp. NPDC049421 TaxID=3155275 RepID=UPI0034295FE5